MLGAIHNACFYMEIWPPQEPGGNPAERGELGSGFNTRRGSRRAQRKINKRPLTYSSRLFFQFKGPAFMIY